MVFARYIAFILSTYLGKFIRGLNKNSVNFSLLRGSFELKSIELAPDILSFSDHLQLESGTIGSLSVSIPWHSLYSRRCEVAIRDVDIVVVPKYGRTSSSLSFFKSKEEFLAAVQAVLANESKSEREEKEPKDGFFHRLTQTILKNLAFRLENVSFKLEDNSGCWQGCSACVRAQIGKMSCEATDSKFTPVFIRPEDQTSAAIDLYRIIAYEDIVCHLLYTTPDLGEKSTTMQQVPDCSNSGSRGSSSVSALDPAVNEEEEALRSSCGMLLLSWEGAAALERAKPSLGVTLVIRDGNASWNPRCLAALGVLSESVRFAPQRAFAWHMRPHRRLKHGVSDSAKQWWQYSAQKVLECRKTSRERSRFSWDGFVQRKVFLTSFFRYCLVLLQAPWLPDGLEAAVDDAQLARTPARDVMTCWYAARWYVRQYAETNKVPQGPPYTQFLRYLCLHAKSSSEAESQSSKLSLAQMNVSLTLECARLTAKLDDNLQSTLSKLFIGVSKKSEDMYAQLSVLSVAVVAQNAEDFPLLSVTGADTGALLSVAKTGSNPVHGQFTVDSVATCFDFSFQQLLFSKVTSYVAALKPFMHQRLTQPKRRPAQPRNAQSVLEKLKGMSFSQFSILVHSIAATADGVSLRIQKVTSAFVPHVPLVARIQEVAMTANDESLIQACSISITPVPNAKSTAVEVVSDSATLSTNVEGFEYVKLLLCTTAKHWKREADNAVIETSSFCKPTEETAGVELDNSDKGKLPVKVSVHFGFIECGSLALDKFGIQATLADGWHIHLSAAGSTTEGWCHSVPPHPQDSFIDIDVWADAYLQESPFSGNIEGNGIGFLFTLNHVTLCLGDELADTAEALFDIVTLLIFNDEDRHVYLRNDSVYTTPHISGRLIGSDVKLLLESDGGDLTLLPGYAAAMKDEASRNAFVIPVPPMPVTIEFLGKKCIDLTLHRYGDKRMDIAVVLRSGVNAFLCGTPAHIPLLPPRDGAQAEIELHLSAPSEADLPVFPYSRVDIALKLSDAAVVAHVPTIMALWMNFNTPSLPFGRIRNIGSRVHFTSRPSRPGKALAPRSPTSAAVEAIGAAALASSSPLRQAAEQAATTQLEVTTSPSLPPLEPCPIYTTPIFPSDVTLRVEVVRSELYYPWGEGSVAPLFLHATVPRCELAVMSRDACVEASVRGLMRMPCVATSFYAAMPRSPNDVTEQRNADSKGIEEGGKAASHTDAKSLESRGVAQTAEVKSACADGTHPQSSVAPSYSGTGGASKPSRSSSASAGAGETKLSGIANASHPNASASPTITAFPDAEEDGSSNQVPDAARRASQHSSTIQVYVTYTMDSRPPYRPGSSNDSLAVSLRGTAVPGSGALPGPLHICLRSPAEVAAWLTFFSFFNPANTVPLSTSDAAVFAAAFPSTENNNSNGTKKDSDSEAARQDTRSAATETQSATADATSGSSSTRCMKTSVRLAPIVFHLPFAGAAAVLWEGVEFTASSRYNALRIPLLEVFVHEELLDGPTPSRFGATGSSLERLRELREEGYAVLSLRGGKESSSSVAAVPGVLLEMRQQGPSAADTRRRLVIPALQGQTSQKTTLVQLHACAFLPAVATVFAVRSAQCALLNAVIQRESQRMGLLYACCHAAQPDSAADRRARAELQPFLAPPMVVLIQNACLTYDWESGLRRGVRAGITVGLHNVRCNDYEVYARAERQRDVGVGDTSRYPVAASIPFLVEVASMDAYLWWTSADSDLVVFTHCVNGQNSRGTTPFSRLARATEEEEEEDDEDSAAETERSVRGGHRSAPSTSSLSSAGMCMPLLLHPVCVHTSILSGAPTTALAQEGGDTSKNNSHGLAASPVGTTKTGSSDAAKPSRWSATRSENSPSNRTPHAASTASFHTMPSTSTDLSAAATASPPPATGSGSDAAAAPVFEVSPVHVVLSTSAYVVLSDAIMRQRYSKRGNSSGGGSGGSGESASAAAVAHTYSLVRRAVHQPHSLREALLAASSSSSFSSQLQTAASQQSGGQSASPSQDDAAPAATANNAEETFCFYHFDAAQQCVWVETVKVEGPTRSAGQGVMGGECLASHSISPAAASESAAGAGVKIIPLSSVCTVNGLLPDAVSAQLTGANAALPSSPTASAASGAAPPAATPAAPEAPPPPLARVTTVSPVNAPACVAPRLLSRVNVTELCIRLVLFQDVESSFNMVGEARDFWQRYTVVHTASRRAAMAAESATATATDPPAPSVIAFLAAAVPALRMLLWSSACCSAATSSGRQRVSTSGPVSLLEESGVDALCVQLRGAVMSRFTDACSILLEACVCTSSKSPSRPLLAVTQVEVYLPTSSVTYPSLAAAANITARDLNGVARHSNSRGQRRGDGRDVPPSSTSPQSGATSIVGAAGANECEDPSSPAHSDTTAEKVDDEPQRRTRALAATPSKTACERTSATGGGGGNRHDNDGRRPVVMMGEVGLRVDAITVDISAMALRAWLSCLVEQPVAALREAAEEKERWVAFWSTRASGGAPGTTDAPPPAAASRNADDGDEGAAAKVELASASTAAEWSSLSPSLLQWRPGRGLRIYEARDPIWSLQHDITLSRDGLVLFFSSRNTNLMTVRLNGHSIILDEALLQRPDGLPRTVMVIQGGLTVRFIGSGRVQLPLEMWNPALWNNKGSVGVEAVLLPFMAIGEGSYLECVDVRLGFSESVGDASKEPPTASATATAAPTPLSASSRNAATAESRKAAQEGPSARQPADLPPSPVTRSGTVKNTANGSAAQRTRVPLTHRSVHLVLPHVSLIMEPRQESRQVHLSTGVELWTSVCGGVLLRDDLRCTGLAISAESIYDATTTARTAVLAPVDVSVCSNNGRHHAVSLGAAQVDLGRADLLLLSTYVGEVQAVRSYAKYLTHSRVEKEFLELVEETLAWKAAAPVDLLTDGRGAADDDDDEGEESTKDEDSDGAEKDDQQDGVVATPDKTATPTEKQSGASVGMEAADQQDQLSLSQRGSKAKRQNDSESPRLGASEPLFPLEEAESSAHPRSPCVVSAEKAAAKGKAAATVASTLPRDSASRKRKSDDADGDSDEQKQRQEQKQQQQQQEQQQQRRLRHRRRRCRQRTQQQFHARGFSWVVFTPAVELTISDHRYPLLQFRVQDTMLRRTSTSALASTSLLRCQQASVRVYGRGRWDALLPPSAAVTWSLTRSVSRHSSNRHVQFNVEGIQVQCSHLIVAKLLYITRQLKMLSSVLQRRLAAAASTATVPLAGEKALTSAANLSASAFADGEGAELPDRLDSHVLSVMTGSSSSSSSSSSNASGDVGDNKARCHSSSSSSSSSSRSRSSSSDSSDDDATSTAASVDEHTRSSRRRVRVSTAAPKDPASLSVTIDSTLADFAPSSRSTRMDAVSAAVAAAASGVPGGVPVTASVATHRLLNSFCYTLFAGICEREAVVPTAVPSSSPLPGVDETRDNNNEEQSAAGSVPSIWRCKELYCLPPASATDIFVSYRRARSLVLTFFPVGCVAWDDDAGTWVLNATGETDLAAKAVEAHQQQQRGARAQPTDSSDAQHSFESAAHAAMNWIPFTVLQYGMARPVAVRTTTRVEVTRPVSVTDSLAFRDNHTNSNHDRTTSIRPRALGMASGSGDFSCYKIRTYALALTCVDPEEEAESMRYPIVVAPGELNRTAAQQRDRRGSRAPHAASSTSVIPRRNSAPLSRRVSSGFVDSAAAGMSDGSGPQDDGGRNASGCSVDAGADQQQQQQHHERSPRRHAHHRSQIHSPTPATLRLPHASAHHRGGSHGDVAGSAPDSTALCMSRQSGHAAAAAAAAVDDSGDGDLLVVRLQARSSLLNETGCTLQLHSLTPAAAATTADDFSVAETAKATSVTVPPGWRLPLEEEDVYNEVVLRVCCPSARWVSAPTTVRSSSPSNHKSNSEEERGSNDDANQGNGWYCEDGAESSAVIDGASADHWYEARLTLGDLDSGRFLSLSRVTHPSRRPSDAAVAGAGTGVENQDKRPLILFVVLAYSSDGLIEHIALYPRLTLVNHLGVHVRVAVFQQDPAAGPQTPDEAMLLAPWTAPYVGRGRHERERFHRSLVALGAHDALPHQHALPLHFCTYNSNLVLGLSFSQSTGDSLMTRDLESTVTYLREAVDRHPRMLLLHDSHGRTFYVQVSVMPRTVVLSVALWVYNLTEYPLLLCDSIITRRLCPGQSSTTGIIPSQGEPFLIGCRLSDFTQGFFAIGLDGGWSGAVPIDVGSAGVFVSAQSRLGIQRSCNYSILFPNAQEGRPMVLQITPRWVFYNNTQKRLRIYFRFPGLAKAMHEAEKKRRQLQIQQGEIHVEPASTNTNTSPSAAMAASGTADGIAAVATPKSNQTLRQADDNVATLVSLATVQLNPGDYHVSCVGPIEGNQFCVQDVLESVLPSITSITKDNKVERRDASDYYESQLTPYMDVDRPGEATFNLWAAPRAPGKRVAVCYGGDLIVQRPVLPHPTWLEPYDVYATDAVITGRIAIEVQNTENVLTVLLQPIQGTKILLQNRTARDTVMVRQQGSRRRNRIPPRQNRFFLWEDARQEHRIRVHILGFKGRWFDVDFSAGECQVTYHEDCKAAAEAEALAAAQLTHPWPTHVKSGDKPHTPFSFFVRGYANLEKTQVTIIVTESMIPLYASIDSWRTSVVLSLQVSMVRLSWIQEVGAGMAAAAAMSLAAPFGAAAAGVDGDAAGNADGQVVAVEVEAKDTRTSSTTNSDNNSVGRSGGGSPRLAPLTGGDGKRGSSMMRRRGRGVVGVTSPLFSSSHFSPGRSGDVGAAASSLLFSIILEGLQLERLSTEDTDTFFFVIHQMQWIDEKLGSVFVYRARPRLPPTSSPPANNNNSNTASASGATGSSPTLSPRTSVSRHGNARRPAPSPPSSTSRPTRAAMLLPKAAIAATTAANRVLDTVFGQSDAFLLAMEKQNDVEFSYNFIKYADGVTRVTELRYLLTPLVVILTDFWLVDVVQEMRRLRVLLGLRKQAATTQTTTTTTVPIVMMLPGPAAQQQQQKSRSPQQDPLAPPAVAPAREHGLKSVAASTADAGGTVITVMVPGEKEESRSTGAKPSALSRLSSHLHHLTGSDVVIEEDNEAAAAAAVSPPALSSPVTAVTAPRNSDSPTAKHHLLSESPLDCSGGGDVGGSSSNKNNNSRSVSDMEATVSSSQSSNTQANTFAVIRRPRRVPSTRRDSRRRIGDDSSDAASRSDADMAPGTATTVPASAATSAVTAQQSLPQHPSSCAASSSTTPRAKRAASAPAGAAETTTAGNHLTSTSHRSHLRSRRSASLMQQQPTLPHSSAAPAVMANTAGFVSQSVFLLQLVQEVRVRLQRQGTGLMAGSLAAVTTHEGKGRKSNGLMNPLRSVGVGLGGGTHRRQFVSTTVRHHRGALQRGGAGDGLAGAAGTATDVEGVTSTAAGGVGGAAGADTAGNGPLTTTTPTATSTSTNSSVNTVSFMFIERLEVHRVTLYVTFNRHRPDPLRPILGAYAWMLPSQLNQREFYLPAWTLTRQVETVASLQARLIRWGTHSLREQWTKVTKLGTLLDALQFWQHRTLPLHGAPQTLTLEHVQQQLQERAGRPLLFAPCVSSGGEEEEGGREEAEVTSRQGDGERPSVVSMPPLSPEGGRH